MRPYCGTAAPFHSSCGPITSFGATSSNGWDGSTAVRRSAYRNGSFRLTCAPERTDGSRPDLRVPLRAHFGHSADCRRLSKADVPSAGSSGLRLLRVVGRPGYRRLGWRSYGEGDRSCCRTRAAGLGGNRPPASEQSGYDAGGQDHTQCGKHRSVVELVPNDREHGSDAYLFHVGDAS
jgi:hypothetical protein